MLGATAGDIIGSRFEFQNHKGKNFDLFTPAVFFTDDTVLTWATARVLLTGGDYAEVYRQFYRMYPGRGYGARFRMWAEGILKGPYGSWGNGSAMRVSPVAWAFDTLEEVLKEAERSAEVTHNHPEGIKGAQGIAAATFLARTGATKADIKAFITRRFGYDLDFTLDAIRPTYTFDVSCQGSVPQAIVAFLESRDFEDAIRNAISIGGDSDTIAAMTGAMAEAYYEGIPKEILKETWKRLDTTLKKTILNFTETFPAYHPPLDGLSETSGESQ